MFYFVLSLKIEIMNSREMWWSIGDGLQSFLGMFYDNIGNIFNYSCIILGFVGLFYWLNLQRKFNNEAVNNPDQIK